LVCIAVDAMGGDHGPAEILSGVSLFLEAHPDARVQVFGPLDQLLPLIPAKFESRIEPIDAPDIIGMGEAPTRAFRTKKNSSIYKGLDAVKNGRADAFMSAGSTGAVMAFSTLILGRHPRIERPAIATVLSSKRGPVVMLDMGASVDSKPHHLFDFSLLGTAFSRAVLGVQTPRVGLLNIGEEPEKGGVVEQETFGLMSAIGSQYTFVGNVEGRHIFEGVADVVVCDGFVGNNLLKFGEGVASLFFDFFRTESKASLRSMIGAWLLKPAIKSFYQRYDYSEYGGAPLLGVNGISVIAHGKSHAYAIKNALLRAYQSVNGELIEKMDSALS
jgi:phosphate acyltransferase